MTLVDYITALKRHWIVILLLGLLGAGGAYAYAQTLPPQFTSEASVMVIPAKGDTTGEWVQGSNYVQNLVQTYTVVASSPLVLNQVIDQLGLNEQAYQLARRVTVSAPLNTVIINIAVTSQTAQGAQEVANAIAATFSETVADLSPKGADGQPAVRIATIAPARLPGVPSAPNTRNYALLGLAVGLGVGVAVAVIRRLFGTRLSSPSDIAEVTEAPLLGEVAAADEKGALPALVRAAPGSRLSESLRNVVASLRFVNVERPKRVLLITSPKAGEGKTSLSLGISIMLAEVGHRVLYIEADLRRPKAGVYTHLENAVGLTSVLVGDLPLEDAIQEWGHPNLHVLASGRLPPNPVQLLSSDPLRDVLAAARESYDFVIVDSAPILPVSDTMWLAPIVDGTLLVIRYNQTTRQELQRAASAIEGSRTALLGIIANDVKTASNSPYYTQSEPKRRPWRRRRSSDRPGVTGRDRSEPEVEPSRED